MANPRLPNITEAEQELLYEKLNVYNQGKASYKEAGCYLVVLPREGHPDYSLWFYTPLLDRRCILFIEDLKPDIIQSLPNCGMPTDRSWSRTTMKRGCRHTEMT